MTNEACKEIRNAFNAHAYATATLNAYCFSKRANTLAMTMFNTYIDLLSTIQKYHTGMTREEINRAVKNYRAEKTDDEYADAWLN